MTDKHGMEGKQAARRAIVSSAIVSSAIVSSAIVSSAIVSSGMEGKRDARRALSSRRPRRRPYTTLIAVALAAAARG